MKSRITQLFLYCSPFEPSGPFFKRPSGTIQARFPFAQGGGVCTRGKSNFVDCIISGNEAIQAVSADFLNMQADCSSTSAGMYMALFLSAWQGGGVAIEGGGQSAFHRCEIKNNHAFWPGHGGGLAVDTPTDSTSLSNANLIDTIFKDNDGFKGSAIWTNTPIVLQNNSFIGGGRYASVVVRARGRELQGLSSPASLIYAGGANIDYGYCAAGSTPGKQGVNVPIERDFTGCPFLCPNGTWGMGGETGALRLTGSVCAVGCEACPPGATCESQGLPAPNYCEAGHYNPDAGSQAKASCRKCESGSFQPERNAITCKACPSGKFVAAKGSTACRGCAAGGYCEEVGASSASVFQLCEPGTFSDVVGLNSSSGCRKCGLGFYQPMNGANSSSSCLACTPGSFAAESGLGACARCPAGTFQDKLGATACDSCIRNAWCSAGSASPAPCPAGTVGVQQGLSNADQCESCPQGAWCSAGMAIDCPKDTYNDQTGQANQGACVPCPAFSESLPASTSLSNCHCEQSFYDEISHGPNVLCRSCPIGTACDSAGLTLANLPLAKGFWRTSNASAGILRCPDAAQNDTACIGGPGPELCKPWTTGPCAPRPASCMTNPCLCAPRAY